LRHGLGIAPQATAGGSLDCGQIGFSNHLLLTFLCDSDLHARVLFWLWRITNVAAHLQTYFVSSYSAFDAKKPCTNAASQKKKRSQCFLIRTAENMKVEN